jgi:hypothetical protein
MDISAFTISRVTQQAQGSIVSASVLIMIEMKSLVNYKFYKERGRSKISWSWNDYTKESLFSWCVKCEVTFLTENVKLLITIKRDKWRWIQEVHQQETGKHDNLGQQQCSLNVVDMNPITGWIKYFEVMNIQDASTWSEGTCPWHDNQNDPYEISHRHWRKDDMWLRLL